MVEDTKKNETPKEKPASADTGEGDKYETTPVIERAREERERLEKVKEELKIENDRAESIMARRALGGDSEAGQTAPEEFSEEEKKSRARIKAVADASGSSWGKNYE